MRWCLSEPTLAEMLSDPLVGAMMAADRVAPEELEQTLRKIAGTLGRHRELRQHGCSTARGTRRAGQDRVLAML